MGYLSYLNRFAQYFLYHITFANREFYDNIYYNMKVGFIMLKLCLICGDIIFVVMDRTAYCYYNSDFAGVLKIHEVLSTMIILLLLLHVLDILYQKIEMSYEGEKWLYRYMKLLFGFTPLKFFGYYIGMYWILYGDLAYECAFHDPNAGISMDHY